MQMAVEMGWTPHPSMLQAAIRQRYRCSPYVAGKVYSRLLDTGKIRQVFGIRLEKAQRDSAMTHGGFNVSQGYFHWITDSMTPNDIDWGNILPDDKYWMRFQEE